ncbi:hypothetical protein LJB76_01305 [Clostridia bacterium OttesenSCG-928-O13]|nr:hypothetical protein [Clostridia bacterium OttesenSCG-928-O13]
MPSKQRLKYLAVSAAKILLKSLLLLPIPLFIMWFNFTTAASVARKEFQYERDSAMALLEGKPLAAADLMNERLLLSQLIQSIEEPFDTIAVGSSRIMQLSADIAGVDSFYNCGLSGADYRDILNVYYQFEKAGMLPNNMIIALDPWILNADPTKLHGQSDAELFSEFLNTRLGYQTGPATAQDAENPSLLSLLSVADFQRNLDYALYDETPDTPPNIAEGDLFSSAYQIKMPDGTALYPASYRDADEETVDERARLEATTFLHMDNYQAPDAELRLLFHRFIHYVRSQGVNVILMLMPYNPIVYNYASERTDIYPGFFYTEPWFVRYAQLYDVPLYGSYNPFVTNTAGSEYYDGLHVKPEAISGFFPGIPAILRQQKAGNAKSPWLISGPRVQYEVAQRLVVERYSIAAPEVVRQGYDEIINGEVCYLVHRYSDDGDNPILLATYAVTRREGVIYRWDTDVLDWIVDLRFPR